MKKTLLLTLFTIIGVFTLAGCSKKITETNSNDNASVSNSDAVSSASIANDETTFVQKISKDGNYIIITTKDLTFTNDLTVDGNFTKKDKDGNDVIARSLAFASTKEDGTIDKRYTVTVPRIVINSENTLLEDGIIKGDVYVQSEGFRTKDATIDGNLYFATQELMDAFQADDKTTITGEVVVKKYTK